MADFRKSPMDSKEGKGRALRAWDEFSDAVGEPLLPLLEPILVPMAAKMRLEMLGFWLAWHLHGGFEGLERMGMNRATIFRKISKFRTVFGQHPDEYRFAGVEVDPKAYLQFLVDEARSE